MNSLLPFVFKKQLFVYLLFGFILATIFGTISHECGHYLTGKYYGNNNVHLGYNYTNFGETRYDSILKFIESKYDYEIKNDKPFPLREQYMACLKEWEDHDFYLTLAGPLETMLTGTIGLLLLLVFRKKYFDAQYLEFWQWLMIFVALFWLRELFNLCVAFIKLMIKGHIRMGGDEFILAKALHWNPWSIYLAAGILSAIILGLIVFKFIPLKQRLTFLLAGLAGGLAGAYIWEVLLGPRLMP